MAHGPVRLKNLQSRFLPLALLALFGLWWLEPRGVTLAVGLGVAALGIALRGWAAGHLVKTHELVWSGPYAHLRHPLYVGSLACALGFAIAVAGVPALLLAALFAAWFGMAYLPRKDSAESHRLEAAHGAEYVRYRAAVPAFWPQADAWRGPRPGEVLPSVWQWERWRDNNELGTVLGFAAVCLLVALRAACAS